MSKITIRNFGRDALVIPLGSHYLLGGSGENYDDIPSDRVYRGDVTITLKDGSSEFSVTDVIVVDSTTSITGHVIPRQAGAVLPKRIATDEVASLEIDNLVATDEPIRTFISSRLLAART